MTDTCRKCGQVKLIDEFVKRKETVTPYTRKKTDKGYIRYCLACIQEQGKKKMLKLIEVRKLNGFPELHCKKCDHRWIPMKLPVKICPNSDCHSGNWMMLPRVCSKCSQEKEQEHFPFDKRYNRYRSICKVCSARNFNKFYERVKRIAERRLVSGEKQCCKCQQIKSLENFRVDKDRFDNRDGRCRDCHKPDRETIIRKAHLRFLRKYGIGLEEYDLMFKLQDEKCAICGQLPTGEWIERRIRPLHIDHDHKTGKVRGLLCDKCNQAIGLMNDNPILFIAAAKYLHRHSQTQELFHA